MLKSYASAAMNSGPNSAILGAIPCAGCQDSTRPTSFVMTGAADVAEQFDRARATWLAAATVKAIDAYYSCETGTTPTYFARGRINCAVVYCSHLSKIVIACQAPTGRS